MSVDETIAAAEKKIAAYRVQYNVAAAQLEELAQRITVAEQSLHRVKLLRGAIGQDFAGTTKGTTQ